MCSERYEYVVVGAGPAGIQMAYFLEKANRSYIVLEAGSEPGTFFETFPRHRKLISINKRFNGFDEDEFNLRHDWNSLLSDEGGPRFTEYSTQLFPPADTYVRYLNDFVKKFHLKIRTNTRVTNISRRHATNNDVTDAFTIATACGDVIEACVVFMATGAVAEDVPGVEGRELGVTYGEHDIDQTVYENRRVCVVGGGNSGFETADHLAGHAALVHVLTANEFRMAWDTHYVGDVRAVNNNIIDMFHLKSLHAVRIGRVTRIVSTRSALGRSELRVEYDMPLPHWNPPVTAHLHGYYDDVIFCTGWKYIKPEMFDDSCKPYVTPCGKYAVLDERWESSVPNVFFLGTSTQQRDQRAASAFIHGYRYSVRALHRLLEHERHGTARPATRFTNINPAQLTQFLIERMTTTSALYQLNYGVLCDLLVFKPDFDEEVQERGPSYEGGVEYFYELPTQWLVKQEFFTKLNHAWVVILKDGRSEFPGNMRCTDFACPPDLLSPHKQCTAFIRPIIQRYRRGVLVGEFFVSGNLLVRADQPVLPGDNNPTQRMNKIYNLICEELQIRGPKLDESMFSAEAYAAMFTPWTKEEIQAARMRKEESRKFCNFDMTSFGLENFTTSNGREDVIDF